MELTFEDVVRAVRQGVDANFAITDEQDWTDRASDERDFVIEFNAQLLAKNKASREPRCRATVFTAPDGIEVEVVAAFYDPDFIHSQVLLQLCRKYHDYFEAEFSIIHEYVEHKEKFTVEMRMFDFVAAGEGENFDPMVFGHFAAFLRETAQHLFQK